MRAILLVGCQGADVGLLEELGEDVGIWCRGCLGDEVCGGAGRGGGLGEGEEGREGVEGAGLV